MCLKVMAFKCTKNPHPSYYTLRVMSSDLRENQALSTDLAVGNKRSAGLELGPRKKSSVYLPQFQTSGIMFNISSVNSRTADPLVSIGRHFCRTVFAMCEPGALLSNGVAREVELLEKTLEDFPAM